MTLYEVVAEVRMFVNADSPEDAEDTATTTLNEVVADIVDITVLQ